MRREEIGEEAAAAEELRGSKTDEEYAEEFANKRRERERVKEELLAKEQAIAEEKIPDGIVGALSSTSGPTVMSTDGS